MAPLDLFVSAVCVFFLSISIFSKKNPKNNLKSAAVSTRLFYLIIFCLLFTRLFSSYAWFARLDLLHMQTIRFSFLIIILIIIAVYITTAIIDRDKRMPYGNWPYFICVFTCIHIIIDMLLAHLPFFFYRYSGIFDLPVVFGLLTIIFNRAREDMYFESA